METPEVERGWSEGERYPSVRDTPEVERLREQAAPEVDNLPSDLWGSVFTTKKKCVTCKGGALLMWRNYPGKSPLRSGGYFFALTVIGQKSVSCTAVLICNV